MAPHAQDDGTYVITNLVNPNTPMAFIDIDDTDDISKFVAPLLHDLNSSNGKHLCCAEGFYTFQQVVDIISRSSGKEVRYVQVPEQALSKFMSDPTSSYM